MANPDATKYIDLTILDLDPQDIFDAAIDQAQTDLPEWVPRETGVEVVTYEAVAAQVAEAVFALNRIPSSVVTVLLRMQGIEYDEGLQPILNIDFTFNTTAGVTIPAGTEAILDLGPDKLPVTFSVTVDVVVAAGSSTTTVAMTGDRFTADANGVTAGTILTLNDALIFVNSVTVDSIATPGRDPEDDDAYFGRGAELFSRMTNALITPSQFQSYAIQQTNVFRAFAIDNYNVVADGPQDGPFGSDAGHITVAVYGNGAALSTPEKDAILASMQSMATALLSIHIVDPTVTTVNVTTDVHADTGFSNADVIANVQAALTEYLTRMNWDFSRSVRRNELIRVIGGATGVSYVNTLTVPAADFPLPGAAPLTTPGTLTVTVT